MNSNVALPIEMDFEVVGPLVCTADKLYLYHLRRAGFQPGNPLDRRVAAHILALVAEEGQSGNVSHHVTPELIGAAIRRLVSNYGDGDDWFERFMRGLIS
jgi:hypothetical protein